MIWDLGPMSISASSRKRERNSSEMCSKHRFQIRKSIAIRLDAEQHRFSSNKRSSLRMTTMIKRHGILDSNSRRRPNRRNHELIDSVILEIVMVLIPNAIHSLIQVN